MKNWDIHPEAELELEEAIANYLSIDENLAYSFDEHYTTCRNEIVADPLVLAFADLLSGELI